MFPLTALLFAGGMIGGVFDAHPELLLPLKTQRRPGESATQHIERELARLDAIMQKLFTKGAELEARFEKSQQRSEQLLEKAAAARANQKAEAEALKAIGGGVADHPKFGYSTRVSPERRAADAARSAATERQAADLETELVKLAAKDPARYQPILDKYREDLRKARETTESPPK